MWALGSNISTLTYWNFGWILKTLYAWDSSFVKIKSSLPPRTIVMIKQADAYGATDIRYAQNSQWRLGHPLGAGGSPGGNSRIQVKSRREKKKPISHGITKPETFTLHLHLSKWCLILPQCQLGCVSQWNSKMNRENLHRESWLWIERTDMSEFWLL